jgi:serine/threonine-protein kinase
MSMRVDELARLSVLLDQAMDMPPGERQAWLARLAGDDAPLGGTLRRLLATRAARETGAMLERGAHAEFARAAGDFAAPGPGHPQVDDRVGPWRLLRELGVGGMGAVWLAERSDGSLGRKVALKLPHLGWTPGLAERFRREREILARLEHPHIARLYDAGIDDRGRPWMALEYVEGRPIDVYCRERGLGLRERLRLMLQVAAAVAFAHGRLVVHRDLKPANILVTGEGEVRLLDFGIAKLLRGETDPAADLAPPTQLTRAGSELLTPAYAAPEQVSGGPVGTGTDVHALGVLLYELLAGVRPFQGTPREVEAAVLALDPEELLDAGTARVETALAAAPQAQLRVLALLGELHTQLGDPEAALSLARRQAELTARVHGEGSTQHLVKLAEAADVMAQLGQSEQAWAQLQRVQGLLAARPAAGSEAQLALDTALASYHNYRGDGEGVAQAHSALRALRARPPSKELVSMLNLLGSLHYNRGEFEAARDALREALAAMAGLGVAVESVRGGVLVNLADIELRLGEVDAALAHYREAAESSFANQGPSGRDTAMMQARYGQALFIEGRLGAAIEVLERAAAQVRAWGAVPDKAEVGIFVLGNLARARRLHGDPARAVALLEEALALEAGAAEAVAQTPVRVSNALYHAQALADLGRFAEAAERLAQGRSIIDRHGHPASLLRSLDKEAVRHAVMQGRIAEARTAWERLDPRRPDRGSRNQALRLAEAAEMQLAFGQDAEALALAREGLGELDKAVSWGDAVHRERLQLVLAHALWASGRTATGDAAEAALVADAALRSLRARVDAQRSPDLARALALRAALHRVAGEGEAAAQAAAQSRRILARHERLAPWYASLPARAPGGAPRRTAAAS